jgi:hypothetical protein
LRGFEFTVHEFGGIKFSSHARDSRQGVTRCK